MKKIILQITLLICGYLVQAQSSCELIVQVENIKEVKGSLMIAIYNHEDHFLSKEMMSDGKIIKSSKMEFAFKGLSEGTYAISLFHDENNNGKLDANFIGIPSEPYAFSNNAKGMFGPPSFEQCKFEVKGWNTENSDIAMSKYVRRQILEAILIYLFGGIINLTVFCTGCFDEPFFLSRNFYISFSYSGLAWAAYWKGSEYLVDLWDNRIPWIEAPVKRFVVSLVSITIYVFLVVWILDLFFDLVMFDKSISEALESSNSDFQTSLLITLGINIFMHGRGFLIEWRQASIDVERLKTEQISSQYNSLKNQVNPHFLFNSLNALSSLVYDNQEKAVEFIRKLSQVYRYVLDSMDDEVVSFEREMDFVKNFIFLQKIRFGENLKVEITDKEPGLFVPPLAIQILVENAIKHNVISEKDPLMIVIDVKDQICSVRNNLKEKKVKDSTGVGLANIKSRYQYLSDREVEIIKTEDYFEVQVPLLNIKNEIYYHRR